MRALLLLSLTALATAQLPLEGATLAVKLKTDKSEYAIGDRMTISVKSQITGYLNLLWTDSEGVTRIAVPSTFSSYDRIDAGQTLQIRDNSGQLLEQTGPSGREWLQAVVTTKRPELGEPTGWKDLLEGAGPFGQATTTYTER
ncbi:DUF4384 domain-containing protein [bacterium CPR1]|nr:DUF4384 domain-containing protein [bacterium CPR1]